MRGPCADCVAFSASVTFARDMAATLASGFLDRTSEREALDRLLTQAREGESAVLVLRAAECVEP